METVAFKFSPDEWIALQSIVHQAAMARTWSFVYERDVTQQDQHAGLNDDYRGGSIIGSADVDAEDEE